MKIGLGKQKISVFSFKNLDLQKSNIDFTKVKLFDSDTYATGGVFKFFHPIIRGAKGNCK
jgi:hypothetical protein